ncbi:MAG: hypothetical protein PHF84_04925 [bacterium]|nr:hypothetical protein [bacterium]
MLFQGPLFAEEFTVNTIFEKLKVNDGKVQAISADMEITLSGGGMKGIRQIAKYFYKSPDKAKVDILTPIKNIMVMKGNETYIKTANSGKYVRANSSDSAGSGANNDLFQYKYLQQFDLEIDSARSKPDDDMYFIIGYKTDGENKVKYIDFIFDDEKGVVAQYAIAGSSSFPAMELVQEYSAISGCLIPVKATAKMNLPSGSYTSVVSLKNVKVNNNLGDEIFNVK